MKRSRTFVAVIFAAGLLCVTLTSCGGGSDSTSEIAGCSITRSELGPFSPEAPLGQSMSEDQARARMAQESIVEWVAVSATGAWDRSWDTATARLGQGIHVELTWMDVNGEISGLYEAGDAFEFTDLRVSRSFQGKIEHSDEPLYLPLLDTGDEANFDAACSITAVEVGDETAEVLLDVTEVALETDA